MHRSPLIFSFFNDGGPEDVIEGVIETKEQKRTKITDFNFLREGGGGGNYRNKNTQISKIREVVFELLALCRFVVCGFHGRKFSELAFGGGCFHPMNAAPRCCLSWG